MRAYLKPLSALFGAIVRTRNYLYDTRVFSSYRSKLPVISVGNIAVGGSGKTPIVAEIVRYLLQEGRKPVILSRGYGGSSREPMVVEAESDATLVGDEPLMLYRQLQCPVVIARRRKEGAMLIEERALGDVIVLDDGFQHRALDRDLDIVCINDRHLRDIRLNCLLPCGSLREGWDAVNARADLIIRTPGEEMDPASLPETSVPTITSEITLGLAHRADSQELPPQPIVAFTAIAGPGRFFKMLRQQGYTLTESLTYPDHHHFSEQEIRALQAKGQHYPLVCTEKDFVKLPSSFQGIAWYLPLTIRINEEFVLKQKIKKVLQIIHSS